MEAHLLPLRVWIQTALWATLLHVMGALGIDYAVWQSGVVYDVMAGQLLLLVGGIWLLMVLALALLRMRRWGYLDPVRIILWVLGVSLLSAPLKALGERLIEPLLREAYEAYPEKRAAALRAYFRAQSESGRVDVPVEQQERLINQQIELYRAYRARQAHLDKVVIDRMKVLGVLGMIYGLILGLLLRGGGSALGSETTPQAKAEDSAASS
ncbi:MAG: hypothetical protein N3E49_04690 [Bacteroidia bacterium]|nr:hypothetical protein [Bacteroidia bacterium]